MTRFDDSIAELYAAGYSPEEVGEITREVVGWAQVVNEHNTFEEQQANQHYDALMEQTLARDENKDITPELLHPFVATAGNFNGAVQLYRNYEASLMQTRGIKPREATPAISLDDAIAGMMADHRASRG